MASTGASSRSFVTILIVTTLRRPLLVRCKDLFKGTWLGQTHFAALTYRLLSKKLYGQSNSQIRFRSFELEIDPTDESMLPGLLNQTYEFDELNFVEEFLVAGDTFVDVGANLGLYSLVAARKVGPSGQVVAFEPSDRALEKLRKNIQPFSQIECVNKALGSQIGSGHLKLPKEGLGSSHLSEQESNNSQVVEISTLDLELKSRSRLKPRLIKIDVEGFEAEVLKGARQCLAEHRPHVLVEFNPNVLDSRGINKSYWLSEVVAPFRKIQYFGARGRLCDSNLEKLLQSRELLNLLLCDYRTP